MRPRVTPLASYASTTNQDVASRFSPCIVSVVSRPVCHDASSLCGRSSWPVRRSMSGRHVRGSSETYWNSCFADPA
ncbi:hypothetical protein J421_5397 (plasmid) [Gemmatirosa kalamazoonensis]|uniref:Uncharacterized protein n=1 Tax=Gemmatirosa kalamazoonensis TaxID=861299 RepID=W0RR38_9BACT|nr:hypothetical protein [Gemmatirosa kalamazoonensis]AHG92932.1 hypothetical protein J421_5397 [Gemmatirosa kalamazoonensis]